MLVNFSPQVGAELSGKHYSIILSKSDSPTNEKLTVIALSSKSNPLYLPLGTFLRDAEIQAINLVVNDISSSMENLSNQLDELLVEEKSLIKRLDNIDDLNDNNDLNVSSIHSKIEQCKERKKQIKQEVNEFSTLLDNVKAQIKFTKTKADKYSFALCKEPYTISKRRICMSKTGQRIYSKVKADSTVLNSIDEELIKNFISK